MSYGDITERVGLADERRTAVGGAVGRNPGIDHRAVPSRGRRIGQPDRLCGGIDRKRALLSLEGAELSRGAHHPMQQALAF
ncbi:MGMT family protein [Burkholderia cenocepacia]|uniref:MGMT family protein n=1 Tax=Burkholderia cenocepacia TaxID=95486 RepID=UPI003397D48C